MPPCPDTAFAIHPRARPVRDSDRGRYTCRASLCER